MTRPRISYATATVVALASVGISCGRGRQRRRERQRSRRRVGDVPVGGHEPGDLEQLVGQLAAGTLRPRDGVRLGSQTHRHVRRPLGRERSALQRPVGVGRDRRQLEPAHAAGRRDRAALRLFRARDGLRPGDQEDDHVQRLAAGRRLLPSRMVGVGRQRADLGQAPAGGGHEPDAALRRLDGLRHRPQQDHPVRRRRRDDRPPERRLGDGRDVVCLGRQDTGVGHEAVAALRRDDRLRLRAREDRSLQRQHGHRRRQRRGDRRHVGRRAVGVGRHRVVEDRHHRAQRIHVRVQLFGDGVRRQHEQDRRALLLEPDLGVQPDDAGVGDGPDDDADEGRHSGAALLSDAHRLRLHAQEAGAVRRPVRATPPSVGAEHRGLQLGQPIEPGQRPDSAAEPVDRVRQQEQHDAGVRRPEHDRQPLQARHLGVVGDRVDAHEQDHGRDEARGSLRRPA